MIELSSVTKNAKPSVIKKQLNVRLADEIRKTVREEAKRTKRPAEAVFEVALASFFQWPPAMRDHLLKKKQEIGWWNKRVMK